MRECQDLLVGFMGIGLEKSISVMVCDSTPPLRLKSHKASNVIKRHFCSFIVEQWGSGAVKKGVVLG